MAGPTESRPIPTVEEMSTSEMLQQYIERYGATFNSFAVPDQDSMRPHLWQALTGDRGPLTDEDFEIDVPPGALI